MTCALFREIEQMDVFFQKKTEYLKNSLYQTFPSLLGFSLFLLLSSFFSGTSESGAKLSDLSPHGENSED